MGLDFGALTIPVFVTVWGMGWASCYAILVRPMQVRVTALETKQASLDEAKDRRLEAMEKRLGISPGSVN